MPWNGSGSFTRGDGVFTGTTIWAQNKTAGVKITTSRHDTHDEDLADGIEACLTKNGENYPSANLPMNGQRHTGVGAASARTDYARASQVQDSALVWGGTSSGAANTYAFSLTPAITAYANGQRFAFKSHQSNSGAVTLSINGLTAKAIRKTDGVTALTSGDIANGQIVYVIYDPGDFFTIVNRQSLDMLSSNQLVYTGSIFSILGSTSDASDTSEIRCRAAGAFANGRGAGWVAYGADHATNAGEMHVLGDGGKLYLETVGDDVYVQPGGSLRWSFQTVGDLANDATSGGNIVFNKAGTGVHNNITTGITALGSDQAGATALTTTLNEVSTVGAANRGVRLPSAAGFVGAMIVVENLGANNMYVYPASGENLGQGTNNPDLLVPGEINVWFGITTTRWGLQIVAA